MRELFAIATGQVIAVAKTAEEETTAMWEAEQLGYEPSEVAWR